MYEAIINNIRKENDEIIISILFDNGKETFEKEYRFVHSNDIVNVFDQTIKNELQRINDLESVYLNFKKRIGRRITL